jgi:hypothetical protein
LPIVVVILATPVALLALVMRRRKGPSGGYGGPYDFSSGRLYYSEFHSSEHADPIGVEPPHNDLTS